MGASYLHTRYCFNIDVEKDYIPCPLGINKKAPMGSVSNDTNQQMMEIRSFLIESTLCVLVALENLQLF